MQSSFCWMGASSLSDNPSFCWRVLSVEIPTVPRVVLNRLKTNYFDDFFSEIAWPCLSLMPETFSEDSTLEWSYKSTFWGQTSSVQPLWQEVYLTIFLEAAQGTLSHNYLELCWTKLIKLLSTIKYRTIWTSTCWKRKSCMILSTASPRSETYL